MKYQKVVLVLLISLWINRTAWSLDLSTLPSDSQESLINIYKSLSLKAISFTEETEVRNPAKIYFPDSWQKNPGKKRPLLLVFHGIGSYAEEEIFYLNFLSQINNLDFILVAPNGTKMPPGTFLGNVDYSNKQFWNATPACCDFAATGVDDVKYIEKLLNYLTQTYPSIDPNRIYLFGHSNGGFMVNRIACEFPQLIAAAGSLAGGTFSSLKECKNMGSIPYVQIHAENDGVVPFSAKPNENFGGGLQAKDQWLEKNNCNSEFFLTTTADYLKLITGNDTEKFIWNNCASGMGVEFWKIKSASITGHNAHVPLFNNLWINDILQFLLNHKKATSKKEALQAQ